MSSAKRLKVSSASALLCPNGNPIFPYGATLKYFVEIFDNGQQKLMVIDIAQFCLYELHVLKAKDVLNVAATSKTVIFHMKKGYGYDFMSFQSSFITKTMMLMGYKNGKWEIVSRMLPVKDALLDKLLVLDSLDILTENRHLKPLTSNSIIDGIGIAATLTSFYIAFVDEKSSIIREFSSTNELIKTYQLPFKICDIVAGFRHVLVLDTNGKVYTHGIGVHGELGQGSDIKKLENGFVEIEMLSEQTSSGVQAIAAGGLHSVALTKTGDLYTFGMNAKNNLGPGIDDFSVFDPYPVELMKSVKAVRSSLFSTYVFYEDGSHDVFGDSSVPGITELNGMC